MRQKLLWIFILASISLALSVLMQGPQWLHQQHPLFQGIVANLNSDEGVYMARVQESLSRRPKQTAEAFTGHEHLVGSQFAMIERFYGTVFRFTGWRSSQVLTFLDVLVPVLIFLSLFFFFQLCGFTRRLSLGLAVTFCLLELYNLNRPIHMRSSFLLMLWALMFIAASVRSHWLYAVGGGILLGLLVGVYVWSFMFAWAFFGIYLLWELLEKSRSRKTLIICGSIGVVAALPFVWQYIELSRHPLYEYASFRSGMRPGHTPESWIYSALFTVIAFSLLLAVKKHYQVLRPYRGAVVCGLAAFVYMNQQVIHGITFNFVSHGIFSIATGALMVVGLFLSTRKRILVIAAAAACIYLAAIGYDGRFVLKQWTISDSHMNSQYLVSMLPMLDAMPRARILSDPGTSAFVASSTHHDIVFSVYLKNVLMTHSELASRLCLTLLPLAPVDRAIEERHHLIFPDATSAFGGDLRKEEERLVLNACAELDLDPAASLEMYEVSHVLWNKNEMPLWDLSRLRSKLKEIAADETWVLYRVER